MENDWRCDPRGTNLQPASAWEEGEGRGGEEVGGGGTHHTRAGEGSTGSGEKGIPGRVGAGMAAAVAIDEHPLLRFDSLNWVDLRLGFLSRGLLLFKSAPILEARCHEQEKEKKPSLRCDFLPKFRKYLCFSSQNFYTLYYLFKNKNIQTYIFFYLFQKLLKFELFYP